jgi:hypothetical protein
VRVTGAFLTGTFLVVVPLAGPADDLLDPEAGAQGERIPKP